MKKVLLLFVATAFTLSFYAQEDKTAERKELFEVVVYATNYKYLQNVKTTKAASIPVKELERKVAEFDVKESGYYKDEYDLYEVNFYIPEGTILAAYDRDGKILRTIERFNDVDLPKAVQIAVAERFPEWTITKDVYLVDYREKWGVDKRYKLKRENGDKVLRVKMSEKGEFL